MRLVGPTSLQFRAGSRAVAALAAVLILLGAARSPTCACCPDTNREARTDAASCHDAPLRQDTPSCHEESSRGNCGESGQDHQDPCEHLSCTQIQPACKAGSDVTLAAPGSSPEVLAHSSAGDPIRAIDCGGSSPEPLRSAHGPPISSPLLEILRT